MADWIAKFSALPMVDQAAIDAFGRAMGRALSDLGLALPTLRLVVVDEVDFWRCSAEADDPGGASGVFYVPLLMAEESYCEWILRGALEACFDDGSAPWPTCPHCSSLLNPGIVRGSAYWVCPRHANVAAVGRLAELPPSSWTFAGYGP